MGRYEIDGRVVLVTGAASGIGRDAAVRLAGRGARLALLDRDAEGLERVASEIGSAAEPIVADVADSESMSDAIAAARHRFGGVDVAIAAAGVSGDPKPSRAVTDEEFERVIQVNLLGVWRTLRAVLPDVIERRGYLLPIASLAAAVPSPMIAAYGASKAGVHSIGRTLRFELACSGAKVGVAYFGLIDTAMTERALKVPAVTRSTRGLPRSLTTPVPVGAAGTAIVRGVERRSRRVCVPRWVGPVLSLGALGGPLEALGARDPRFVRNLEQAEREAAEAIAASEGDITR
jgi:NAD(P)-dependent dehydrogenase (short-subunit alcohol dehydrogenase family)